MTAKLLVYELNEVPWEVIDLYLKKRPSSVLAEYLTEADQYTTHTVDSGILHPWSTWPTLHRGVSNDTHNIRYLNQDLSIADAWPPVWDILNQNNVSTGIFGSLQSYPPSTSDQMKFHIPDTFASGSETIPGKYSPFQAVNLRQTGKNKAITSNVRLDDLRTALGLPRCGIRPNTLFKIANHLVKERLNPAFKTRRPLLQPELAFDVFLNCLHNNQPQFVTFFTNHVAGIMHRYWKYSFPDDFDYTLRDNQTDAFNEESLLIAMDQFDKHLKILIPICKKYNYELIVCSSMGQEAVDRGEALPEVALIDFGKFKKSTGMDFPVEINLAMQPDVSFEFVDEKHIVQCTDILANVTDTSGKPIMSVSYDPVGTTLTMKLGLSKTLPIDKTVLVQGNRFSIDEIGLKLFTRDVGTGYHQPEGIMFWQNNNGPINSERQTIDTRAIAPTFLNHFGVHPANYMAETINQCLEKDRPSEQC